MPSEQIPELKNRERDARNRSTIPGHQKAPAGASNDVPMPSKPKSKQPYKREVSVDLERPAVVVLEGPAADASNDVPVQSPAPTSKRKCNDVSGPNPPTVKGQSKRDESVRPGKRQRTHQFPQYGDLSGHQREPICDHATELMVDHGWSVKEVLLPPPHTHNTHTHTHTHARARNTLGVTLA